MRTRKSLFALAMLIAALAAVSTLDSASAGVLPRRRFLLLRVRLLVVNRALNSTKPCPAHRLDWSASRTS